MYKPSYIEDENNYCNKSAYLFAFIYVTFIILCFGILVLIWICLLWFKNEEVKNRDKDQNNVNNTSNEEILVESS